MIGWKIDRTFVAFRTRGNFCTVLMTIAVFLVIGNSIRSDVYSSRASIDVMKLLGATDQFILRPYLYTGMIYAVLGGFVAAVFSSLIVGYFTSSGEVCDGYLCGYL